VAEFAGASISFTGFDPFRMAPRFLLIMEETSDGDAFFIKNFPLKTKFQRKN
jgi:hypothetical protein